MNRLCISAHFASFEPHCIRSVLGIGESGAAYHAWRLGEVHRESVGALESRVVALTRTPLLVGFVLPTYRYRHSFMDLSRGQKGAVVG